MKKTYLSINSIKNYNIRVFYGEQIIYEGLSDDLPEEYQSLQYYDIKISNGLINLYVEQI